MPGATGNATAPGDGRIAAAQLPLNTPVAGQVLVAGAFTSAALSLVGLPGLSMTFSNDGANAMTVQVKLFVQDSAATYDLPAFVVASNADAFVSWDHIAARGAFFTVSGTLVESFRALLSATAT